MVPVGRRSLRRGEAPRKAGVAQRRLLDLPLVSRHGGRVVEDLEIAEYLNREYVAIKVDREERPDIDTLYMAAVQMVSGGAAGR